MPWRENALLRTKALPLKPLASDKGGALEECIAHPHEYRGAQQIEEYGENYCAPLVGLMGICHVVAREQQGGCGGKCHEDAHRDDKGPAAEDYGTQKENGVEPKKEQYLKSLVEMLICGK